MLQFFKYVLATFVGIIIFIFVSVFILAGIGSKLSSEDTVVIAEKSVLKLDLNKPIQEVGVENPFADIGGPFGGDENAVGLKDILEALKSAQSDSNIKGIYLKTESPEAGWATLEEVRNQLIKFKKSGKFIVTYGESFSEKGYYIASLADKIYLNPVGGIEWNGLSAEYSFFKGTFDKLGIEPMVFRVGEFKSAIEMFSRQDMSEASKKQSIELLTAINDNFLKNISDSRKIPVTELKRLADSLGVESPKLALQHKFVTNLGYQDELEAVLKRDLKVEEKKNISYVGVDKYLKGESAVNDGDFNKRIGVLVAEGEITSGEGGDDNIGSEKFVKELKEIRENDKIKAVVIRINSPGGSALASDVMWREIQVTAKKKPVIASMSDVAASGGYYMAMGCDTIVAQPNTITGSIGIFGLVFNVTDFMNNKLGVTFDGVGTSPHADWPTATRDMTEFEKSMIQKSVNEGYETFTKKAAAGRKMSVEKLKSLAQGRVWSGIEAKQNGLVDVIGGVDDAIKIAAKAAKLNEGDYRVRYYPEKKKPLDELLTKFMGDTEEKVTSKNLGELAPYVKMYKKLMNMGGTQTRMPFELTIR
ncbi:signal peptide peptidase SppA [Dyadobacter sediminis]|uniref:Signal peptide peptidase SppA n=1 Tax=Dyadobacter sediminis TaxID=1493691 RepID=A0A5R9KEC3_9BACT|nr:signal peptide peptidase SppA [Dyadobacter sediminis]TLU94469.1 signal peptide peptidase SppA [Dyadobacter sediminis]GGB90963.1 signal peptide peptidase SppA [Dyadobacter sediminis]